MNIKRLKYFFAVADEGNFSRAAERLQIAQPPLSRQVKQLEDEIGVRLFNRSGGSISLTQAGRYLYENGRSMLLAIDRLQSEVNQIGSGSEGRLNVGAGGPSTYRALLNMIQPFKDAYPKIDLNVIPMTTSQLHLALVRRAIDVGITVPSLQDPVFKTRKLMEEALIVATPNSITNPSDEAVSLNELRGLRLIFFPESPDEYYFKLIENYYTSCGLDFGVPFLTLDLEASMCLVASGAGVCILPESMSTTPRKGVKFLQMDPLIKIPVAISYRLDEQSLQIQNFVRIAQSTMRTRGWLHGDS